jgi:hypothetical protein
MPGDGQPLIYLPRAFGVGDDGRTRR